jgi:hypothetical protein
MYKILKITLFVSFLQSMYIWILWSVYPHFINIFLLFIALFYYYNKANNIIFTRQNVFICVFLMILCIYNGMHDNIWNIIGQFLIYLPAFVIILLPKNKQIDILNSITYWFSWLLFPSIIIYLITSYIDIQPLEYITPHSKIYPDFLNYLLYIKPDDKGFHFFYRFNGPFLEPGHLGMICSFLLYANYYDFTKKRIWIIFVSLLLTFSLSGYILLFVGYLLIGFLNVKKIKKVIIISSILIFSTSLISLWQGDEIFSVFITDRLKYDKDKGISGNNRFLFSTDKYYSESFRKGYFLTGIEGSEFSSLFLNNLIGGAGYKIYILQYGLIGSILIFMFYFFIANSTMNKKYAFGFLFLIILAFLQRAYPMWCSWLLPFITSIYGRSIIQKKSSFNIPFSKYYLNEFDHQSK